MLRHAVNPRWHLVLLALAACLAVAAQPAKAGADPLFTGVTNLGVNDQLAFQRTRESGAQFVRIPLYWAGTAPKVLPPSWQAEDPLDPAYHWDATDEAVAHAVQAGLTPVLQIDGAPTWAQRCTTPPVLDGAICDPDPAALGAFATAAARRYNGQTPGVPRVGYWQGLNEPNLSLFFFPQFDTAGKTLSPGLYRPLINAFYGGIKSVDPSNLVIAAGLGPIARPGWTIGPMSFARQLLCMTGTKRPHPTPGDCEGGVHFDIFAIQPYTTGSPAHQGKANDVELGDLGKLQSLLAAADSAGRIVGQYRHTPLWITEFSWDSKPPDPGGLPMKIETRWAAEALYQAWRSGVSHFFWYSLRDGEHQPGGSYKSPLESGLYFRGATLAQDQPKEVLSAFRFPFVAYPSKKGLFFWGRTPGSDSRKVTIQAWTDGHWRRLLTVRATRAGIFQGRVRTSYGANESGTVRARYGKQDSVPFSMRPVPDFFHPPFG